MTDSELHNLIRTRFKEQVQTPQSLTTIYDNDPAGPPTDGSTWCRFSIRRGETQRITVGVRQYRMMGIAYAQLFCGVGKGDGDLLELADAIATAFRSQNASGIRYGTPSIVPVGVIESEGQYQINVQCPFAADTQES